MYWKGRHTDEKFQESEFLLKKYRTEIMRKSPIPSKGGARGIDAEKKRDILSKIGPCMPESRMKFWRDLHESEQAKDLTLNYENVKNNGKGKRKREK